MGRDASGTVCIDTAALKVSLPFQRTWRNSHTENAPSFWNRARRYPSAVKGSPASPPDQRFPLHHHRQAYRRPQNPPGDLGHPMPTDTAKAQLSVKGACKVLSPCLFSGSGKRAGSPTAGARGCVNSRFSFAFVLQVY